MIVERNGEELDRISGGRGPGQILQWLTEVSMGRTSLDRLRVNLRDEIQPRRQLSRALLDHRQYAEALEHFVWLWNNALAIDEGWVGIRGSYLLAEVSEMFDEYEPARTVVTRFRDEAASRRHEDGLGDWLSLSPFSKTKSPFSRGSKRCRRKKQRGCDSSATRTSTA